MSDNRLREANRRYQQQMERLVSSKPFYALVGAITGVALGVLALSASSAESNWTYTGARGALWLAAGALFGAIVGLDLHTTRTWRRLGKYILSPIRSRRLRRWNGHGPGWHASQDGRGS